MLPISIISSDHRKEFENTMGQFYTWLCIQNCAFWWHILIQRKAFHDDVMESEYFPLYWSFVREIYRSTVNSHRKGQWRGALIFFFDLHMNKRLSKQSRCRWFGTPSRSLWRYCSAAGRLEPSLCLLYVWDWHYEGSSMQCIKFGYLLH